MRFVPWFAGFWVAILILLSVVIDLAGQLQAAQSALHVAQSAARAGTNAAANTSVDGDAFDLNVNMAVTAAHNYLAAADVPGTVTVNGDTVTVAAETSYPTNMLAIIGITQLPVHATASAQLIGN